MARRRWNLEIIEQVLDKQNPFIQWGYGVPKKDRKVGEEWTDSKGVIWKKISEDGIVKVNKQMDLIREKIKRICSSCGQDIDFSCDKLDEQVFGRTGKCYTCLELSEMELRVQGESFATYEKSKILKYKLGMLHDFKSKVEEAINYLKTDSGKMGEVLSTGELMTWDGKCNPQWLLDAEKDLIKVMEEIVKVKKEIEDFEITNK